MAIDIDRKFAKQRKLIVTMIAGSESRMIRWMVTLWSSTVLGGLGLAIAVLRSR